MRPEQSTNEYPITAAQVAEFAENGHILVENLATAAELERFRPAICEAAYKYNRETRSLDERDTYGRAFLQITNLWRYDERVREFVFARKFAAVAARLLGVERVRLYHDQALFKEPGGGPTPWHQDQYYWPLDTDRTVTLWMPLVAIDREMGMLTFASGSHRNGALDNLAISDESEEFYGRHIAEREFPVVAAERMAAGDATFHLGWTIHSAGANRSPDKTREAMTIIYFADGARVAPPQSAHQQADLDAWLGGREPGEPADGELNPILNY
ncbi:MAG: phytanoyl-CoA dioxygenase family protein [Acidobacteria bacterium]|nr:phytanoyl-CoA dioxygenase family protein [Acidobacteriota bacterium]